LKTLTDTGTEKGGAYTIIGKVHVAYISNGQVIGLSKINRLVQYYAIRPQVFQTTVIKTTS